MAAAPKKSRPGRGTDINSRELVRLRILSGLSQQQLAEKADISHSYLSLLERNGKRRPAPETVAKLAAALGVTIEDLQA